MLLEGRYSPHLLMEKVGLQEYQAEHRLQPVDTHTASLPHCANSLFTLQGRGWADRALSPSTQPGPATVRGLRNGLQHRQRNQLTRPHSTEVRADSFPTLKNTKPFPLEKSTKKYLMSRLFSCYFLLKQGEKKKVRLAIPCHELGG